MNQDKAKVENKTITKTKPVPAPSSINKESKA